MWSKFHLPINKENLVKQATYKCHSFTLCLKQHSPLSVEKCVFHLLTGGAFFSNMYRLQTNVFHASRSILHIHLKVSGSWTTCFRSCHNISQIVLATQNIYHSVVDFTRGFPILVIDEVHLLLDEDQITPQVINSASLHWRVSTIANTLHQAPLN